MGPRIFSCALWRYIIFDSEDPESTSWIKQFRVLKVGIPSMHPVGPFWTYSIPPSRYLSGHSSKSANRYHFRPKARA
ncbi:hypothetical protein C2857_002382 [Epichloe festucae Fl1]|uniref:Uncharacterized protein n=1 Tax=Epichloe festucae (strain Fl1) TaxID=877507 RepID=A0A7S9PWR2_EPIFF|nr:hypothetical protein C2857_002382 [Epichloe festucae Fl1]